MSGQIDNIDFAACHSHLTGEDWWRQIRRFQQPITAQPCCLSIISPQPMAYPAAGLESCLLSCAVKGLNRKFTMVKSSGGFIKSNVTQRGLFHPLFCHPKCNIED